MKTKTQNLDLIEAMGIEYEAEFVPFSRSRNKDDKNKSLNWIVTLTRNWTILETDYMQGIAHHPDYQKYQKPVFGGCTIYQAERYKQMIEQSTETGKRYRWIESLEKAVFLYGLSGESKNKNALPAPILKDILYSLVLDSDVLQHDSFESWAGDFGYDVDSRQAEKTYQDCLAIALKINQMFSSDELEQLREYFQDY